MINIFTERLFENTATNHYVKVFIYYWAIIIIVGVGLALYHGTVSVIGLPFLMMLAHILGVFNIITNIATPDSYGSDYLDMAIFGLGGAVLLLGVGHYFRAHWYGQLLALLGLLLWGTTGMLSLGRMY